MSGIYKTSHNLYDVIVICSRKINGWFKLSILWSFFMPGSVPIIGNAIQKLGKKDQKIKKSRRGL